ncbi:hypothetical protein K8B83_05265 [Shewanella inventionis]|uniref:Uncharacterized protein n=1 Tax=Shewanella inventionis TaxID=1738770 RepID=A0ABQ1ILV0_9GAMM|nr:hypothetical protein [Shewanella inventionis]MCL1156564.1 hypothetical protein [Shewanella inventionis]UAL44257.1 hypothetical protein K8B83_05265 [Shewanella inventionis]GGB46501.1 hypothetical protein GCM10011607_03300 [Shewanella inventionis]
MPNIDKAELIQLFTFPRARILQSMEVTHCPHAVFFNHSDEECITCHQGEECLWINHNDEMVALEMKSVDELKQQLLIAVDFIDSNLSPHHMSRRKCQCENCRWLRQVQLTLDGKAKAE